MGMSRETGKALQTLDHIQQSVLDILTTPIGSRVMNRAYGSGLFALVDAPLNASTKLSLIAATHEALHRWEPRVAIDTVTVSGTAGSITLNLYCTIVATGQRFTIEGTV